MAETEAGTIHGVDDLLIPQRGFDRRNDRVLAWSAKDGVTVYAVGSNVAKFGCAAVKDPPSGAAWTETSLLVWTSTRFLLDPENGKIRMQIDVGSLADMEVMANPDVPARDKSETRQEREAEEIAGSMAVGDRAIFTTTRGRIFCVDSEDGHIEWQSRPGIP